MAKKRRTKEQKIIARLRRELKQKQSPTKPTPTKTVNKSISLDKSSFTNKINKKSQPQKKTKATGSFFSYEPKLIKKDLLKTIIISLIILSAILILKQFFLP